MAFSGIFYPGNAKKREEVIAKVQRVYVLMEENFRATDRLITFLNGHIDPSPNIGQISVDKEATFAVNANTLINKMHEVQGQVDTLQKGLKDKLDPDVYEKLTSNDTDFRGKLDLFKNLKRGIAITEALISSVAGFIVIQQVVLAARFLAVIAGLSEIAVASFAGVVAGLFVAGAAIAIDAIISAIIGAVERSKLNSMLDELNGVLGKFEKPSEAYTQNIFEVLGVLKFLLKK